MSSEKGNPFGILTSVKVNLNPFITAENFENENDDSDGEEEDCAAEPEVEAKVEPEVGYYYQEDLEIESSRQFQLNPEETFGPNKGRKRKQRRQQDDLRIFKRRNKYAHLTSNLNPWKEEIVIRVLSKLDKIKASPEPPRTGPLSPDEDPRRRYLMEYDSEKEVFIINGTFHASLQDEEAIVCHTCGLVISERSNLEQDMFDHILSTHMNVYKCLLDNCEGREKQISTFGLYKLHLASSKHQNAERSALEGQPASSREKRNCIKCGESFYFTNRKAQGCPAKPTHLPPQFRFPCVFCGLVFSTKKLLASHSMSNQCRKVGIKCDKCGIYFTAGVGLAYHNNRCYFDNKACRKCSQNVTLKQDLDGEEFSELEAENGNGGQNEIEDLKVKMANDVEGEGIEGV